MSDYAVPVTATRDELIALVRWHQDLEREQDFPSTGRSRYHLERALYLLELLPHDDE